MRTDIRGGTLLLMLCIMAACGATTQPSTPNSEQSATAAATTVEQAPEIVRIENIGLCEPESVLHDVQADVYLVSNINGNPFVEDDNGFVSQIAPSGAVIDLMWINGADPDITLNAPKGSAIVGDELFIADITLVRRFNRLTGQALGEIAVPGALFLNDLVATPDGAIYVSDTGLRATADGFEDTRADAIYRIEPDGTVTLIAQGNDLGNPNGLALRESGDLLVNTLDTSRTFYELTPDGAQRNVQTAPGGQLDALIVLPDNQLLLSSWETNTVYALSAAQAPREVFRDTASPSADVGYDAQRGRLLIPLFVANSLILVPMTESR
jgi:hypothetical protein